LNKIKKIFVCCTEQSGDNIASNICKIIKTNHSYIIDGICGSKSEKYFRQKYFDISEFKTMGIVEILLSLIKYIKIINFLAKEIILNKYDLIITIDSPDFNYQLAKKIRKKSFKNKIIHIVAPSVWAWREGRAKKFANVYDEIFTLFRFENDFFNKYGLKTTFIGHPIYYISSSKQYDDKKYISFLLGSRENEIKKLFNYYELGYKILLKNNTKKFRIFIPTLPHLEKLIYKKTNHWKIDTLITTDVVKIENYFNEVYASVTCSGTASLEIAKRMIPQLIIYKFNFLTTIIGKIFVKVKYANLINIFSNKMIIPELVNFNLTKKKFAKEFKLLINDKKRNSKQLIQLKENIKSFQDKESPYDLCVNRILELM